MMFFFSKQKQPITETDSVHINDKVFAWACEVMNLWNRSGRQAKIAEIIDSLYGRFSLSTRLRIIKKCEEIYTVKK